MRLALALVVLVTLAGCNREDARVAPVKRGMHLVERTMRAGGCEDRLFDNYPRFVSCTIDGLGVRLKKLPDGMEGAGEMALLKLPPDHAPLELEQGSMLDTWPKDVPLWLGGPGGPWSVVVRADMAGHDLVIAGYGEDTGKPLAEEKIHYGK